MGKNPSTPATFGLPTWGAMVRRHRKGWISRRTEVCTPEAPWLHQDNASGIIWDVPGTGAQGKAEEDLWI